MCYLTAIRLAVAPLWTMVKIGDTPSDMEEGRNAGMWTIGITRTGNETGLSVSEWNVLAEAEKQAALARAEERLTGAGADYVAESVADCCEVIDEIEARVAAGERP
jgi:phosphonoacetaldehyde hydrolase